MLIGGLLAGLVIGLTGMGGGALLTPLLVTVFGVPPLTAISSDLVVSLIIKPFGAAVHGRRGTIRRDIVTWLCVGSVPAALVGSYLLDHLHADDSLLRTMLGGTLVVAAVSMLIRWLLGRRTPSRDEGTPIRPLPTIAIGVIGGLVVGLTSVGSGSLVIVLLTWLYPRLDSPTLVGTDLAQAIPLVGAATLGHLVFGHVSLSIVGWLLAGAIPGVLIGSRWSSRAPDHVVRPALVTVLAASGLKLLRFI